MTGDGHQFHEPAAGLLGYGVWPGAPGAPTVLALHGITSHHLAFTFLGRELAEDARMIAPDLRGRGGSRDLGPPWGMADHVEDCAALLRAQVHGPVTVVGHSMGAFVAIALAHRHPGLVSSLVLVDGGLPLSPAEVAATDAVIAVIRDRLGQQFPDPASYRAVFAEHPGLRGVWGPEMAAYADHDLVGQAPRLTPASRAEAVVADQHDIAHGDLLPAAWAAPRLAPRVAFLHAPRGLLDQPPGVYGPDGLARHRTERPEVEDQEVPGTNHYTIAMSPWGAARVGDVVRDHVHSAIVGGVDPSGRV